MIINRDKMDEYVKNLKRNKCPLCGKEEWAVSNVLFYSSELTKDMANGNIVIGGPSRYMPYVTLTCVNCGNTHIINALVANLYEFKEDVQNLQENIKEEE